MYVVIRSPEPYSRRSVDRRTSTSEPTPEPALSRRPRIETNRKRQDPSLFRRRPRRPTTDTRPEANRRPPEVLTSRSPYSVDERHSQCRPERELGFVVCLELFRIKKILYHGVKNIDTFEMTLG